MKTLARADLVVKVTGAFSYFPVQSFLEFTAVLAVTEAIRMYLLGKAIIVPRMAPVELAALAHVLVVAQKMLQFRGFLFVSKRVNARLQRWIVNLLFLIAVLKLIALAFDIKVSRDQPLLRLPVEAASVTAVVHESSPYILMMPLVMFAITNLVAFLHVKHRAATFGVVNSAQERYLRALFAFVDAPVVVTFLVVIVLVYREGVAADPARVLGYVACTLLVMSNIGTGTFEAYWREQETYAKVTASSLA